MFKHTCQTGSELSPNVVFKTPKLSFSLSTHKPMGPRQSLVPSDWPFSHALQRSHASPITLIRSPLKEHFILSSPLPNPRRVLTADQAPTSSRPLKLQRRPLNLTSSAAPSSTAPGPQARPFSPLEPQDRPVSVKRYPRSFPLQLLFSVSLMFIFFSILNALWCECLAGSVGIAFFFFLGFRTPSSRFLLPFVNFVLGFECSLLWSLAGSVGIAGMGFTTPSFVV